MFVFSAANRVLCKILEFVECVCLLKGGGYNPVDLSIQSRWFQGDMFILTLTGSPVIYCRIRRNRILLDLNSILEYFC